jgi:heat shock protein HslJ
MLVKFVSVLMLVAVMLWAPLAAAQSADPLAGTSWQLVSLGQGTPVAEGTSVTLAFGADGQLNGDGGCNSYGGSYTIDGSTLTIGQVFSTLRLCGDAAADAQESAYFEALRTVSSFSVAPEQLIISYGEGQQLIFVPQPTLAGSEWVLVSLAGSPVVEGSIVTIGFDAEGRAYGTGGCNRYTGSYDAQQDRLTFSQVASTRMMCVDTAVMEQEQAFFNALSGASSYTLGADTLVIATGEGAELVFAPASSLTGTQWVLVSLNGADVTATAPTLEFAENNRAGGTGGCNRFNGSYEVQGSRISFGPIASTRAACPDEAANAQETAYLAALESASGYTLANGELTISYGEGQTLVFAQVPALSGSQWQLVSLNGTPVIEGSTVTIGFGADNRVFGSSGCNSYGGTYEVEGSTLTFSMLVSTLRACTEEALNQQESAFVAALDGTVAYTIRGAELVITGSSGAELRFVPLEPAAASS